MNTVIEKIMALPTMTPAAIDRVQQLENEILKAPQSELVTEHAFHAGLYARTIMLPAGDVMTGVTIKIPTLVIVDGDVAVNAGEHTIRLRGRHVLPAGAGRKQAFLAFEDTHITMLFATNATTVEDAENEFTDEADRLMSRRSKTGDQA